MKIPFYNFTKHHTNLDYEIKLTFEKVLKTGQLIGGSFVDDFEKKFAMLLGAKHCISVGNGTDALFISLKVAGIGYGDEVITVANGWISASESISLTGATPVFVDIDSIYDSVDVECLENAITNRTKAIILTHFQGQMCDMKNILRIANKYELPIIEDCAQSHLARYQENYAGVLGLAGCFSFYPTKNLGAYGDAGSIVTQNDEFARKARLFARHGSLKKNAHEIEGINSRMDTLQAAFLLTKLPYLKSWTAKRRENALLYYEILKDNQSIILPQERFDTEHVYHLFVIKTSQRNELKEYLAQAGIETLIHYPTALPFLGAYRKFNFKPKDFPITHAYQKECLSLPIYPELEEKEILYIGEKLNQFFK